MMPSLMFACLAVLEEIKKTNRNTGRQRELHFIYCMTVDKVTFLSLAVPENMAFCPNTLSNIFFSQLFRDLQTKKRMQIQCQVNFS